MGKFLTDVDLNQNELQYAVIQNLNTDPIVSTTGQIYYNTNISKLRLKTAAAWVTITSGTITIPTLQQVTTAGAITTDVITVGGITSGNLYSDGYTFGISDNFDSNYNLLYIPYVGLTLDDFGGNNTYLGYGYITLNGYSVLTTLNIDPTPTNGSTNAVSSDGVFDALGTKQNVLSGTGVVKSTAGTISYINGTNAQYIRGDGTLAIFPSMTTPTLQQVTTAGNTTTDAIFLQNGVSPLSVILANNYISLADTSTGKQISISTNNDIGFIGAGGSSLYLKSPVTISGTNTQTLQNASGTIALTSDIGTWGALNYPTWSSGTPFVKMTAIGTFALDANTYVTTTSLLNYVPYTGATSSLFMGNNSIFVGSGNITVGSGSGINNITLNTDDGGGVTAANAGVKLTLFPSSIKLNDLQFGGSLQLYFRPGTLTTGNDFQISLPRGSGLIPLKVNGYSANGAGEITIPVGTGTVTSVTATSPITSSGGTTPDISTSMATNKLIGRSTAGVGVMEEITIGTGLSLSSGTLSNSATYTSPLTTKGDIFVRSTVDTRLPVGANTQILAADSTEVTGLKWINVPATGVTSVAALTLGTSGTDLTSTVANGTTTPVITLNVPTASATNRGALSSTDWSAFDSKQAGSVNLTSLSALSYASTSFVKMTAAGTFALDNNTYVTGSGTSTYIPMWNGTTGLTDSVISDSGTGTYVLNFNKGIWIKSLSAAGSTSTMFRFDDYLNNTVFRLNSSGFIQATKPTIIGVANSNSATLADSSAILELVSNNGVDGYRGFLLPRVTTTNRNAISSPATGLTIYNTTTNSIEFYNGSSWTITTASKSINVVSVNTSAGSASSTDYVYLASGTINITLPTAVGNQNLYTIKNVGTGVITVDTTSSETIDGSLTAPIRVQYLSLTLVSDGANWNII